MTGKDAMQIPADTRLAEELAEDDVVEMANLTTAQTGVPGTIFISTAMGGHGPRVKLFAAGALAAELFGCGRRQSERRCHSLPLRVVRQASPQVIDWVSRNKDTLLDFWYHGDTWIQPEVNDFIQKLKTV